VEMSYSKVTGQYRPFAGYAPVYSMYEGQPA